MRWLVVAAVIALSGAPIAVHADAHVDAKPRPGRALYDRHCAPCHGLTGDGLGPAAWLSWRTPRAFTRGLYKWRSTPVGQPPLVDDLKTTIRFGAPGTSMPGFAGVLSEADLDQIIDVLRDMSPSAFVPATKRITLGPPPPTNPARGDELWTKLCKACHGTGTSDGMSAFALSVKPYPYAKDPIHRPRGGDDLRTAIAKSIATGIAGTPMQSYAQYLPEADIWAVADHVVALNATSRVRANGFDTEQIELDRASPRPAGVWPGASSDEVGVFGSIAIPPQGPPPSALAPAQASLEADRCARCHASQMREWIPSRHHGSMSPAVRALTALAEPAERATCARCHAPLAEQADPRASLRNEGITCAACHIRTWTRVGPVAVSASLLPIASYPKQGLAMFERADVCAACHQLPPREAVNAKPLQNTYKEWLDGPYMKRGVQCQHCHMPDRAHAMPGIHDRTFVRAALGIVARATRHGDQVDVVAELHNAGAGHYLPTSATPMLEVTIELVDAHGNVIPGGRIATRLGRDVYRDPSGTWHERSDTRIAPGGTASVVRAWSGGRTAGAARVRVSVVVMPDAFYERDLVERRAQVHDRAIQTLLDDAIAIARRSRYLVDAATVPIGV